MVFLFSAKVYVDCWERITKLSQNDSG